MLRDFLVALSLVNLWFFNVWRLFLISHSTSFPYYHWKANPAPMLLATMLDVLLLSALLLIAVTLARRSRKPLMIKLARLTFLAIFFLTVTDLLVVTMTTPPFRFLIDTLIKQPQLLLAFSGSQTVYLWVEVLGLATAFVLATILLHRLVFRREQLIKLTTALLLIASPFVLVTFGQATLQWLKIRGGEQFLENTAPDATREPRSRSRTLWIIFDEMDFRLSFVDRPSPLELPEFDRLRSEAMFAQNAFPPGGDTVLSLPSLISGKFVAWSQRTAPNELMLTFGGDASSVAWSTQPNAFSRARAMGFNSAVAGWYHPYCRIIGGNLRRCFWKSPSTGFLPNKSVALLVSSEQMAFTTTMFRIGAIAVVPQLVHIFMAAREGAVWRKYHFDDYVDIQREALSLVRDPNIELILVHYPIPHPPPIYDGSKHEFSFSKGGYLDNLALADHAVAELRQELEKSGLWESTTLLISSDHRLRVDRVWQRHMMWQPPFTEYDPRVSDRVGDERVPFILKLAGEKKGFTYEPAFNTVLSQELLLAILTGRVSRGDEIRTWLDQHRTIGQSPYVEGEK